MDIKGLKILLTFVPIILPNNYFCPEIIRIVHKDLYTQLFTIDTIIEKSWKNIND